MKNNKDYADLLELYADIIKKQNEPLSNKQKEIIKNLGETFFEKTDNISIMDLHKKQRKSNSKNILEDSRVELIKKSRRKKNKHALENSNIRLVKDIGKEPGE